jgi:hypothetical protein
MNEISAELLLERDFRNPLVRSTAAPIPILDRINYAAVVDRARRMWPVEYSNSRRYPACSASTAIK